MFGSLQSLENEKFEVRKCDRFEVESERESGV